MFVGFFIFEVKMEVKKLLSILFYLGNVFFVGGYFFVLDVVDDKSYSFGYLEMMCIMVFIEGLYNLVVVEW